MTLNRSSVDKKYLKRVRFVQINPGEKKGTVVPGRKVPVVEDVEGGQLAPQHLHGHHVDDQHPDGAVQDFNLLTNNTNIFRN